MTEKAVRRVGNTDGRRTQIARFGAALTACRETGAGAHSGGYLIAGAHQR